ncbi:hypothetical protein AAY473_009929 [Plecturocebus cupreus]
MVVSTCIQSQLLRRLRQEYCFNSGGRSCNGGLTMLSKTPSQKKKVLIGQAPWLMPVIPALCEAKAGRSQGQEIKTILANMIELGTVAHIGNPSTVGGRALWEAEVGGSQGQEFETGLANMNSPRGQVWWFMPVIPALWEAKVGESQSQEFETSLAKMVNAVSTKYTKISQHFGRLRWADHLRLGVQDQPDQHHGETPSLLKIQNYLGVVAYACRAQWLTPVISALSEADAGRSQDQEFKISLTNMAKPRLYLKIQKLAGHGGTCLYQLLRRLRQEDHLNLGATGEAEAGEWLESRRWRLQQAKIVPLHSSLGDRARLQCARTHAHTHTHTHTPIHPSAANIEEKNYLYKTCSGSLISLEAYECSAY